MFVSFIKGIPVLGICYWLWWTAFFEGYTIKSTPETKTTNKDMAYNGNTLRGTTSSTGLFHCEHTSPCILVSGFVLHRLWMRLLLVFVRVQGAFCSECRNAHTMHKRDHSIHKDGDRWLFHSIEGVAWSSVYSHTQIKASVAIEGFCGFITIATSWGFMLIGR